MAIVGETKRRILARLQDGGLHGYELAKQVDIPVTGIYQHLRELEREGLISQKQVSRKKIYQLTEKGSRLIDALQMNDDS